MATGIIRILSFDPGLSTSGWAVCDYNTKTGELVIPRFGILTPNRTTTHVIMRDVVERYGKRIITLVELRAGVSALVAEYNPDYIVAEDNFFHDRRPTAFAALLQWTTTVELWLRDNVQKPLFKIPARLAKACVAGHGNADKDKMANAVLAHTDIRFKQKNALSELLEHTIDAVAIGYTFTREILPSLAQTLREETICQENEPNEIED